MKITRTRDLHVEHQIANAPPRSPCATNHWHDFKFTLQIQVVKFEQQRVLVDPGAVPGQQQPGVIRMLPPVDDVGRSLPYQPEGIWSPTRDDLLDAFISEMLGPIDTAHLSAVREFDEGPDALALSTLQTPELLLMWLARRVVENFQAFFIAAMRDLANDGPVVQCQPMLMQLSGFGGAEADPKLTVDLTTDFR